MLVQAVMKAPVISVDPSTSVAEAAKLMLSLRISGLPVVQNDGTLVGMISEGDLLRRTELGTQRKRSWWLEFFASPGKVADEYVQAMPARSERSWRQMSLPRGATLRSRRSSS